ncbi:MAG: alpha/beta hydrolase [Rhodocyclaceae bacterium]|nr:alpha/beta hydrolase [Rhodocyclaceae bacterium]
MTPSRGRYLDVRGLRYHLREWGPAGAPQLLMLHGWMDLSASFQFVVERLHHEWHVIAPDWRGFGRSARAPGGYWFPDYLADLDAIVRAAGVDCPINLIGHSMGGNVAALYAGVRPRSVARLVLLDAFGLADRAPDEAPGRYRKWLDQLARDSRPRRYESAESFADRLQQDDPRLDRRQALQLAAEMLVDNPAGGYVGHGDPRHRDVNPVLYRRAEAMACWRQVRAPVLSLLPQDDDLRRRLGVDDEACAAGRACFRDFREIRLTDTGHNLHRDVPAAVAAAIEDFVPFGRAGAVP